MKHVTFRGSHVYACLAILLEDFKINKTDQEIALEMRLPYLFTSNRLSKTKVAFVAGTSLQGKAWFDLFLNQYQLAYIEEHLTKLKVLTMLKTLSMFKRKALLSINIDQARTAVVFSHYAMMTETFLFILPEETDSSSYKFLELDKDLLLTYLDQHVDVGYINPTTDIPASIVDAIKHSLKTLDDYDKYIKNFCQMMHTNHKQKEAFELVFRALLIDIRAMMKIKNNEELYQDITQLGHRYIKYLRTDEERFIIPLGDAFSKVIASYRMFIETYLKRVEHKLH